MKVTVGSYYSDDATGAQREIHITLEEEDALRIFKSHWEEWDPSTQVRKLTAMADIFHLKYASDRGLRSPSNVSAEIQAIMNRDLK